MPDYVLVDKTQLEADLTVVADSIRAKGGTTEALEFPLGMKSAVESIQTGITKPEQEKTIEITENGTTEVIPDLGKVLSKVTVNTNVASSVSGETINMFDYVTNFGSLFRGCVEFPENSEVTITPKTASILNATTLVLSSMIRSTKGLKRFEIDMEFGDMLLTTSYFADASDVEIIDFKGRTLYLSGECKCTFNNVVYLKEINGVLDFSNKPSVNTFFNYCDRLETVTIAKETLYTSISLSRSSLLSDASIQSIVDGLATVETAQTLTLHADVKAKLTEEQLTTITGKNWTLA